jgi:hypothetical protein
MQLWCKKWLLLVAGIIVLAHDLTPHHHHYAAKVESAIHHHDDDDDDHDESNGFASHHSIDHSFVNEHFLNVHMARPLACPLRPVLSFEIGIPALSFKQVAPLPADESPPDFFANRQLSYRGPPSS